MVPYIILIVLVVVSCILTAFVVALGLALLRGFK